MTLEYRTKDGDVADLIAWKQYGARPGAVEALLEANPGLADAGPVLPPGLIVRLPDLPPAKAPPVIRIWG